MQGCACKSASIYIQRSEPLRNFSSVFLLTYSLGTTADYFKGTENNGLFFCSLSLWSVPTRHFSKPLLSRLPGSQQDTAKHCSFILQEHLHAGRKCTLMTSSCFQKHRCNLISSRCFPFNKITATWKSSLNMETFASFLQDVEMFREHTKIMSSIEEPGAPGGCTCWGTMDV